MDMLDQALDTSSQDKGNESATSDETPHLHSDGVTYRVVQVAHQPEVTTDATQVVSSAGAALVGQQVAQAIITNPFTATNGNGGPGGEGQFYVMMSPQDVLQTGQRTLAPRTHQFTPKLDGSKTARDEKRRATHNEVERRRRDKINNWIIKLSKIIPDCASDHTKQGQVRKDETSKGGILAKACDYIQELRNINSKMPEILKDKERLSVEVELLRQQCEELKNENQMLRAHLQQHGIAVADHGPR